MNIAAPNGNGKDGLGSQPGSPRDDERLQALLSTADREALRIDEAGTAAAPAAISPPSLPQILVAALVAGAATGSPELGLQFGFLTAALLGFLVSANVGPLSYLEDRTGPEGSWQRDLFHVLGRSGASVGGALPLAAGVQALEGLGDFDDVEGTYLRVFGPVLGVVIPARMLAEVAMRRLTDGMTERTRQQLLRWAIPTVVEMAALSSGFITGIPLENMFGFMLAIGALNMLVNLNNTRQMIFGTGTAPAEAAPTGGAGAPAGGVDGLPGEGSELTRRASASAVEAGLHDIAHAA